MSARMDGMRWKEKYGGEAAQSVWWSQRDLNPCFNYGHVFDIFSHGLNDVVL